MRQLLNQIKLKIKHQIYLRGWIVRQLGGLPAGIDLSYDIIHRVGLKRLKTIIDCGAHYGETALYFRERFPEAKIYSFEPVKSNFEILKKNTAAFGQIQCYPYALGDKDQTLGIQLHDCSFMHSLSDKNRNLPEAKGEESVQVKTLDSVFPALQAEGIDLLKIDTEGYEINVLEGARSLLVQNKIKLIFAEATVQDVDFFNLTPMKTLEQFLKEFDFKMTAIYDQDILNNPTRLFSLNVLFTKR